VSKALTKDEIMTKYPDPQFWRNLTRIHTLADLLSRSIVAESYRVQARLVAGIRLTDYGNKIVSKVQNNAHPRNECVLAMLLDGWWSDLLVDPMTTDIEALEREVSEEIRKGAVRHPYIYGRTLYDKGFENFPHARGQLSHGDTNALLAGVPNGVFQLDEYVTGPYGILRSRQKRFTPPEVNIPLYHCDDLACNVFHRTRLTTSRSRIVRVRERVSLILRKESPLPGEWSAAFSDYVSKVANYFSWHHSADLIRFVGDCFTGSELELILRDLLDSTQGKLRSALHTQGIKVENAEKFVSELDDASRLQLILLCKDSEIVEAIDVLVLSGRIVIPVGEDRYAKVRGHSGYFRVSPECSSQGVRFTGTREITLLRVHDLLNSVFNPTDPTQAGRLEWITRGVVGDSFEDKISGFVRHGDMGKAVVSAAFDSGSSLEKTKDFLQIGPRAAALLQTEEELAAGIIWRVGINRSATMMISIHFIRSAVLCGNLFLKVSPIRKPNRLRLEVSR
jgi:hypothetical protein